MHTFKLVCYLLAAVLFTLSALNVGSQRVNLLALALLAWVLVPLAETVN